MSINQSFTKFHRITKKAFYDLGGFANPKLFRKQGPNRWYYYSYN